MFPANVPLTILAFSNTLVLTCQRARRTRSVADVPINGADAGVSRTREHRLPAFGNATRDAQKKHLPAASPDLYEGKTPSAQKSGRPSTRLHAPMENVGAKPEPPRINLCRGVSGSGVVLLQSQREGLEEPFGSHSIGKERHHETSAHLWWHQQRQHSYRPG